MESFECAGWLHITHSDLSHIARINIHHSNDHVSYWPIGIPPDVEEYVRANTSMTPTHWQVVAVMMINFC